MNKYVILFWICCMGFFAEAQYDGKGDNVSRFRPGLFWFYSGMRPADGDKPVKYDRLIMDVTYNDWIGDRQPFKNHWASIGLNTNLLFDIPLTRGTSIVSLGIGLSHQYTNIRHNSKLVIDDIERTTLYVAKDSTDLFKKGMLAGNSFSVPIELRFRSKGWRHFKFHLGGKIGYQANLLSKYVSNVGGHREVVKSYKFPDECKLIYSAHMRIGFRNWALFASYNFNPIFTNSKSTQLNLLQMGISVSLF